MKPYVEFQKDMKKLIDHALSRDLCFANYHFMMDDAVRKANETHECGSAACLAGYAPEVWPGEYRWQLNWMPGMVYCVASGRNDSDIIWDIAGLPKGQGTLDLYPDILHLSDIFNENKAWTDENDENGDPIPLPDKAVALERLKFIMKAQSYEELSDMILDNNELHRQEPDIIPDWF
jgi:hypothetical protein